MRFHIILSLFLLVILSSCVDDKSSTQDTATAVIEDAPSEVETTYLREPVNIVASTGEDYPESLIELGFPILPKSEVTSVGNTDIENGTVVMQMESLASIEQIKEYYQREMPKKGWEEKKMKIFQGADAAFSYRTDVHSTRILVINDKIQDFRKVAITLNKRVNPDKLGAQ